VYYPNLSGVSRSASLVIAYLMQEQSMTLSAALSHVRSRKPDIQPNKGFLQQLCLLDGKLHGVVSIDLKIEWAAWLA
jgi:protein-tyrosine phosphatase